MFLFFSHFFLDGISTFFINHVFIEKRLLSMIIIEKNNSAALVVKLFLPALPRYLRLEFGSFHLLVHVWAINTVYMR